MLHPRSWYAVVQLGSARGRNAVFPSTGVCLDSLPTSCIMRTWRRESRPIMISSPRPRPLHIGPLTSHGASRSWRLRRSLNMTTITRPRFRKPRETRTGAKAVASSWRSHPKSPTGTYRRHLGKGKCRGELFGEIFDELLQADSGILPYTYDCERPAHAGRIRRAKTMRPTKSCFSFSSAFQSTTMLTVRSASHALLVPAPHLPSAPRPVRGNYHFPITAYRRRGRLRGRA